MTPQPAAPPQLTLFEYHEVESTLRRRKALRPVVTAEVERWLSMPLFGLDGQPTPEACVAVDEADGVPEAVDALLAEEEPTTCERQPWTLEGVLHLHSVLLEESLKTLGSRGNPGGKKEILDWIFEPEYLGTAVRHGREVPVYSSGVPFSFAFCCRLERMNPERIREVLLGTMPPALKQYYQ